MSARRFRRAIPATATAAVRANVPRPSVESSPIAMEHEGFAGGGGASEGAVLADGAGPGSPLEEELDDASPGAGGVAEADGAAEAEGVAEAEGTGPATQRFST